VKQAAGLSIPEAILLRADKVIESLRMSGVGGRPELVSRQLK